MLIPQSDLTLLVEYRQLIEQFRKLEHRLEQQLLRQIQVGDQIEHGPYAAEIHVDDWGDACVPRLKITRCSRLAYSSPDRKTAKAS